MVLGWPGQWLSRVGMPLHIGKAQRPEDGKLLEPKVSLSLGSPPVCFVFFFFYAQKIHSPANQQAGTRQLPHLQLNFHLMAFCHPTIPSSRIPGETYTHWHHHTKISVVCVLTYWLMDLAWGTHILNVLFYTYIFTDLILVFSIVAHMGWHHSYLITAQYSMESVS